MARFTTISNTEPTRGEEFGNVTEVPVLKTEGTSVTYGQDVRMPDESLERNTPNVAPPTTPQPSPLGNPPPLSFGEGLFVGLGNLSRADTVVKVVDKVEEVLETACGVVLTRLTPDTKSNVAVVAASTNENAAVVIARNLNNFINPPPTSFRSSGLSTISANTLRAVPNSITGQLLSNIAKITPNIVKRAVVVGSQVKTKEETRKALEEAQKVDLTIGLRSMESESIDFNTVKIPNMEFQFVYNFFREGEEDVVKQEDPAEDPLLNDRPIDVPRYVQLDWSTVRVTEPVTGTELEVKQHEEFRSENFFKPKGVAAHDTTNVPRSLERYRKRISPLKRDGQIRTIVDIHDPASAFASIANSVSFPNSLATTVFRSEDSEVIDLPILDVERSV